MRPLRLDIAGFAAFRDPVTVDFTDADYFALTGSTGSGKSTVIDAMTFALYGSAPRWGRDNAIQYALAPTANRCTVRLVFDLADQRYVVAREVRRSGKSISQKNPRLERYLDPAATGDPEADEPTESLAADARTMRTQVAELLGLDFEDFCTCVVLPQGDFATFLKASVAERQAILLKLLGARHYEAIGRMANRRATEAGARIDALQGQLTGYADATQDAEDAARDHELRLAELATTISAEVAEVRAMLVDRAQRSDWVDELIAQVELLSAVHSPAGVDDLQRAVVAADEAYATAAQAERQAGAALDAAEQALGSGPQRAGLEETLRWYTESAEASQRLPEAAESAEQTETVRLQAAQSAVAADQAAQQARDDHASRRAVRDAAAAAGAAVERELAVLEGVVVPEGTADLGRAGVAAQDALARSTQAVEAAENTVTQTVEAVTALPERSALTGLQRTVSAYAETQAQLDDLRHREQMTAADAELAAGALATAAAALEQARSEVERLRAQEVAADLRPHLAVGHACPVCDQTVATLPPPLSAPALAAGRAVLQQAEAEHQRAVTAASTLQTRLTGLTAQSEALDHRLADLGQTVATELPEAGTDRDPVRDAAAVADLVEQLDQAQAAQQAALRDREQARRLLRAAEQERDRVAEDSRNGWATLHATHGRLSALGAPAVTAPGLADAWAGLVDWSTSRATHLRTVDLVAARTALNEADRDLATAAEQLRNAAAAARAATDGHTAAAVAASQARAEHDDLVRRLDQLETLLTDRPTASEAQQLLAEHHRLDEAATLARSAAQVAARARQQAEVVRDERRAEHETARTALLRSREPLVRYGAPSVDDLDLSSAWTELTRWAGARARSEQNEVDTLRAGLATTDATLTVRLTNLISTLAAEDLAVAVPDLAALIAPAGIVALQRIPTEVELALERARAATAAIVRRRAEAAKLQKTIATDTETQQVSRQLGQMLSARQFPQWLASAALDTLVADASTSLLELSGRQFELTHTGGEFFVIDHADADSLRSVKTLSGGETFQASLALALALSEQLSTLAAGGRTTLDSIFLDEGFGTLDPDALEIVASTLENLAQGNRMVGIVTHVPALAERVPVRFEVSRDPRTSTIERVGG